VVAGSIPVVYAVLIAALIAVIGLLAGKVKGDDMDTRNNGSQAKGEIKTIATKLVNTVRKFGGQFLLVIAAMGSSWTARNVALPLWQGPHAGRQALRPFFLAVEEAKA
jgi:hypothetical protein